MHAIHIGIGSNNDIVVAQVLQTVFNVEGMLKKIEFFVLVDDLLGQAKGIERLSPEAEDSLSLHIAGLGNGTACGIPLSYEQR